MAQNSTFMSTDGGSEEPPVYTPNNLTMNICMMNANAHLSTRTHDYRTSESFEKDKEASNPLIPIKIENTMGETMNHIPKGVLKKASHNPNMRVT